MTSPRWSAASSPVRTAHAALTCLTLVSGCGRVQFAVSDAQATTDASMDAMVVASLDAPASDAPASDTPASDTPALDAPSAADADLVDALVSPDTATMADAFVVDPTCIPVYDDPVAAADDEIFRCGAAHQLGACWVLDGCGGGCACTAYVRSDEICDMSGACRAPISGTGCSDSGFYSGPPFSCSGDRVVQSACMLRYLMVNGLCDGL